MTMDLSPEAIASMKAGCDAVPDQNWEALHGNIIFAVGDASLAIAQANRCRPGHREAASHIARCDPATIRAMCKEIERLRDQLEYEREVRAMDDV